MFFITKKKRLFLIIGFIFIFNYIGNLSGLVLSYIERNFKKAKFDYINKKYPLTINNKSAVATQYKIKNLS